MLAASTAVAVAPRVVCGDEPDDPLPDMIERVRPSVVSIMVDTPPRQMSAVREKAVPRLGGGGGMRSRGAGFVLADLGYIVTNAHVLDGAQRIQLRLHDGTTINAAIAGTDTRTDLAVLSTVPPLQLPGLDLALARRSRVGEQVIAIGDPFGYAASATFGRISAIDRTYGYADPVDYLQHDAPINGGNSGGPLLDTAGRVVGVNTAIPDETPYSAGLGFAIPADRVNRVVSELVAHGRVRRGYLGIAVQELAEPLAESLTLTAWDGLIITMVVAESPGEKAGLTPGDLLVRMEGVALAHSRDLSRVLLDSRPGQAIQLEARGREGISILTIVLGEDRASQEARVREKLQPEADSDLTPQTAGLLFEDEIAVRGRTGTEPIEGSGARIAAVDPEGLAAAVGLTAGDVVTAVGRQSVDSGEEAAGLIEAATDAPLALLVRRGAEPAQYVVLPGAAQRSGPAMLGNQGWGSAGPF
jgi:S1-C subfamily serine protease